MWPRSADSMLIMIAIIALFTLPKLVPKTKKRENYQNLTGKMMVKSNPVQLLRESHTRALFVPEKSPFGAKMRVLQGTYKCVPRSDESVSRVQGTHLNRNN